MTIYFDKYIKYKLKYLDLKKQSGGNVEYLYHGTSFYYIKYFRNDGLQLKYPAELFKKINKYWPEIKTKTSSAKALAYVPGFIEKNISEFEKISLTPDLNIAKEYAGGARKIGEGPTYFTYELRDYLDTKKTESSELLEDMRTFYNELNDALQYPSLILAIKVDEIEELKNKKITDMWETTIDFPITPDKLYIVDENGSIIKLLSEDGDEYIKNTNKNFDESKKEFEKQRKINEQKLKDWTETKSLEGNYKYFKMEKNTYFIQVVYDIFGDEYIQIIINDNNETLLHMVIMLKSVKIREIKEINKELQEKLNYIINEILIYTGNNKEYYKTKIKKHLDWIIIT